MAVAEVRSWLEESASSHSASLVLSAEPEREAFQSDRFSPPAPAPCDGRGERKCRHSALSRFDGERASPDLLGPVHGPTAGQCEHTGRPNGDASWEAGKRAERVWRSRWESCHAAGLLPAWRRWRLSKTNGFRSTPRPQIAV